MIFWINSAIAWKQEFNSESDYNKKFLKTKIKSYGYRFSWHKISVVGSSYTCLAVILIGFVPKKRGKLLSTNISKN